MEDEGDNGILARFSALWILCGLFSAITDETVEIYWGSRKGGREVPKERGNCDKVMDDILGNGTLMSSNNTIGCLRV